MKIKKFKFKQLLKLHLLKSRVYVINKMNFNNLIHTNLDQILVSIKRALQIMFHFNQANKCILFIGLPSKLELKINLLTRHVAVPSNLNVQGLISNNHRILLKDFKSSTQILAKGYSKPLLSKLTKNPDLIVLFNHNKGKFVVLEANVAKIPVIAFAVKNDETFVSNAFTINGDFKNVLTAFDKNIFFIGLNFLFKNLEIKKSKAKSK